jgi:PTS system ascorbate-specific IIB component
MGTVRGAGADVILAQGLHASELTGTAPVVVPVTNFLDVSGLKDTLARRLREQGWLT